MKVLVIGGNGFIGKHLCAELRKQEHSVLSYDLDFDWEHTDIYGSALDTSGLKYAIVRKEVDAVVLLAGASNIDEIEEDPINQIELGLMSVVKVADTCSRAKVKLIYASSYFVTESYTGHFYTTIKRSAEKLIKDFHDMFHLDYVILRYGTVYGEGCRGVMKVLSERVKRNMKIYIEGKGESIRHFVHVQDIAEATILAIQNTSRETLTITHKDMGISICDLVMKFVLLSGSDPEITFLPIDSGSRKFDFIGGNLQTMLSAEKSQLLLNWKPKITLEEGIKEMLQ